MKLLVFNILVAGALAYLFLGESEQSRVKSDFEWAKDKVETTVDGDAPVAPVAQAAPVAPAAPIERKTAERPAVTPEPDAKSDIEQRSAVRQASVASKADSSPARMTENPVSTVTIEPLEVPDGVKVAEQPPGETEIARGETVPTGGARSQETVAEGLPPLDDPEVVRRRAIVLDIEDADTATDADSASVDQQVTAMAARERRDALNALAEDMELMFADKTLR